MAGKRVDAMVNALTAIFSGIGTAFFGGSMGIFFRLTSRVDEIGERVARIEGKLDKR